MKHQEYNISDVSSFFIMGDYENTLDARRGFLMKEKKKSLQEVGYVLILLVAIIFLLSV